MKKFFKKQKGRSAGWHAYEPDDMKRVSWCINKGIRVSVVPKWGGSTNDWNVEIVINGSIHLDPKIYNGYNAQTKMYEYYKYYYDKKIS